MRRAAGIRGIEVTLARDWFEARAAYVQSDIQDRFEDPAGAPFEFSPKARQLIYSLSFAADRHDWAALNEHLYMSRRQLGDEFFSALLAVGYRVGRFLPMVTYNSFRERLTPGDADPAVIDPASIDPQSREAFWTMSYSLRYALTPTSAIKIEYDRWHDNSGPNYNIGAAGNSIRYGNPRLLSLSFDVVF